MLTTINATPRIRFKIWSSMRVSAKIAIVETMINVSSIGHSRFQVMKLCSFQAMTAEVVMASRPESVVASPYVGRKNGSIVMMKMPKPKPVVRCTKLAPILSRNMKRTILLILIILKSYNLIPYFTICSSIIPSGINRRSVSVMVLSMRWRIYPFRYYIKKSASTIKGR